MFEDYRKIELKKYASVNEKNCLKARPSALLQTWDKEAMIKYITVADKTAFEKLNKVENRSED